MSENATLNDVVDKLEEIRVILANIEHSLGGEPLAKLVRELKLLRKLNK